ncbi:protein ELYS-like isoform X1 [Dermacentor albipictus]|uniref:protein ELYS-like isoform X1 n=1 Tax=Dermacentor albipictus TaxID=60249 RepID=UPI0038FD0198
MPLSLVPPESVAELSQFQPALIDSAAQSHLESTVIAHINQCGSRAALSCGSLLRGYDAQTGVLYSEIHVGRQERPLVGPFLEMTKGEFIYLVVAVRGGSGGPLLCVCHPVSGRVIRAIHLVAPITHLSLVSAEGLGSLAGGCMALASEDNQLLMLDLCLDSARHYSDESRPATLVAMDGVFTDELPPLHPVHAAPVHGIVHLCNLDDLAALDEMAVVDADTEVTCLQWLPQLRCLGIGLGNGTVHLWDVHKSTSMLVTTLQSDLPVVSLALQEPENDPRCCCYLWVAQGFTPEASTSTPLTCFSVATMHALSFQKKEPSEDGQHLYKGCVSGRLMFQYQLGPDVVAGMEAAVAQSAQDGELLGSRILSFCTVGSSSTAGTAGDVVLSPRGTVRPGSERVEDLLLISWQLVRGSRVLGTYLSIFDINQWYRAQMPRAFRANAFQLCSFIGLFSLAEVVAKCGNHAVLDVRVLPSTVKRFYSPNPMVEQTHFPSSLAFSCICLTAEGTVKASFLGLQRQLLHYINLEGPACLSNASDLYVRLSVVGLIGDGRHSGGSHLSPAGAQKALLNVALENRMIGFLMACLRGHLSGEPLLPFVLDWTWAKVKEVKRSLDILYTPLFDCSGQDATMIGRRMSTHLEELRILNRLLEQALGMQVDNRDVVCVWHEVTGLLVGHLSVLLFLLQSGVLPDHHVGEGLAYPYGIVSTWCQQARSDAGGRLLVDVLIEAVLEKADDANNPSGPLRVPYPPHNLQRATDLYLLRGLKPWMPHAITYYLLLDISSIIVREYREVKEELEDFPAMFNLGTDLLSIVQGIWYLDHGNHKEGTEKLLHAHSVATLSMRPLLAALWAPVVRHLLRCGQAPLALRFLDHLKAVSTSEQMALQLDTLLANRRVVDALELVRRYSHLSSLDQLLGCIVAVARKAPTWEAHKLFQEFLRVPLSTAEEEQLVDFFCELADPTWMCHVILHFLECKRPHAAVTLAAGLRELFREGKAHRTYSPEVRQQAFATLEVMQGFLRLVPLPPSQLNAAARKRSQSGKPVQHLGTLPTRVPHKGTTPRLVTRASALRAAMDPAEASKAPKLPLPPVRFAASESHARTPTARGRRSSLHSGLEDEALSMLCTPPVKLWQGPTEQTPSAAQPSTSTPASILKRRAVNLAPVATTPGVRGNAPEGDLGTCPTPVQLDEDVCPTPEPLVRRLRFAVSDSISSESSHNPDATAESMDAESALASQPEQQSSSEEQTSSSKVEADLSSDRSSQFQTASESESEESATDLQDNPLEPVPSASTPKFPPTSQPVATDMHAEGGKAPVSDASPAAGSSPGHKGRLPAFLIQETARRLHGPAGHDTTLAGSHGPGDEAAPSQPAAAAQPSSPAKSDNTADEEDLDGTPLADDDEGVGLAGENEPHIPPGSTVLAKGPSVLPEETAAPQVPGDVLDKAKMSIGPVEATPLQDDGTELAEDASEPCSEWSAMSLPVPTFAFTERHTTRTEVTVVEEVVATTSSESDASRPCSERSAMSLRLPAFAASEGRTFKTEAGPVEEVIVISASEASEGEQEDDDILILSDTSSVTLPEVLPTRVESPEDSWTQSSGGTAKGEGDVVLTELTDVPPAQLAEPLEMAREPSVGHATAALDVEDIQVEQLLPGYAVCPSEEERSLPKPEDHLQPPNTPATPAQSEGRAVGESYGFVPAVDSPPVVGSARDSGAALPVQGVSSPSMAKSSLPVVSTLKQPPLRQAATGKDGRGRAEFSEKPLSTVADSQHSPSKYGEHETELKSSAEVAAKTPEHESELGKSLPKIVVTSSYNLREKRTPTWKEQEQKTSIASPSRLRNKSGSVSPPQQAPTTPTRPGPSRKLDKSPETVVAPKRKMRSASAEPSTAHSHKKSKALQSSAGRRREKASSVSPKRTTQSPKQKTETPSPKAKSAVEATSDTAGKPSKRLATPRPSRTSSVPSSKRAGASRHVDKQDVSPSPTRQSLASPAKTPTRRTRKSATPSPTRQKAVQGTRQQSTTHSPKQSKPAVHSAQVKTAETPTPVKVSLRTRGHTEKKTPSHVEKTPEKAMHSTRAGSTRQRRSATLSPQEKTARTPSPAKGSPIRSPERAKTSSPVEASARKTRLRHHSSSSARVGRGSSPVPGPSKTETPSKRTSGRVPRTPRRSSTDVAEEPLRTSMRRSLRLTPERQLEGPSKISGARGHSLDTIAEVDTSPTKSDTETSPTAPPTRKGRRIVSTEPEQSAPPKKLLVATRRSRRVSGNQALSTIAEIPDAEMEQEPQPTTSSSQRRRRAKRKSDTELDAEGFKLSKPTELASKGSHSTPPKGEFLFSPPLTRHRQQQMSQSSEKPADAKPVPSTSKEQAPKKKQQQRIKIGTTLMKTPLRSRATASSSSSGGGSRPLTRTPRRKPIRYKLKPRTLEIPLPTPRRQASAAASSNKAGKKTPKKTAR